MVKSRHSLKPTLEDIIGIEYSKLGFFREAQEKIAQLRTLTQELSQKKQQIETIFNAFVDVIVVVDTEFKIRSINNSFFNYFLEKDPIGKFCYKVIKNKTDPCKNCIIKEARKANSLIRKEDVVGINNREIVFEITASPMLDSLGSDTSILLVLRDITEEKIFQRKYLEAEKMAAIGILASGIAHEINNPLTAIYGFAQGIQRRLLKNYDKLPKECVEDLKFSIDIILSECKRCQEIIQSLLTYSRESPNEFIEVNLNNIIKESLPIVKHRIETNNKQKLLLNLSKYLKKIKGNPQQLRQLVVNLLLNAIDAIEDGGHIEVVTKNCKDNILLKIIDTGCGIAEETLSKIFDPFFTTKGVGKGTGLGLTICYNIIKMHQAEIKVESKKGIGTKFTILFPGNL